MRKDHIFLCTLCLIALQYCLPWWIFVIPCLLIGSLMEKRNWRVFFMGFGIVFFVWQITFYLSYLLNNAKIGDQIAILFYMPGKYSLSLASSILSGLLGGLAAVLGKLLKFELLKLQ